MKTVQEELENRLQEFVGDEFNEDTIDQIIKIVQEVTEAALDEALPELEETINDWMHGDQNDDDDWDE